MQVFFFIYKIKAFYLFSLWDKLSKESLDKENEN